jgi:hypothetical protein
MGQVVEQNDTPSIRGMIHHVKHMLHVEEVAGEVAAKRGAQGKKVAGAAPVAVKEAKPKAAAKPKAEKADEPEAAEAKPKAKRTTKKAEEAGA